MYSIGQFQRLNKPEATLITETWINGVLVLQNRYQAQTMAVIDLTLEQDGAGWKVVDRTSRSVDIAGYGADSAMVWWRC